MQILDKSLTPCFKAGTVSHHPAATGSASAVMYHGPGKKTNEKAPWSCSYLQKTLWLLWCGITYTVKNIIIYIREYKPERFQWSSHATPFLWKGQQQGFPLLVLQDSVKAVSTFCACLWPLGSLCLSGWDRCWRNYRVCFLLLKSWIWRNSQWPGDTIALTTSILVSKAAWKLVFTWRMETELILDIFSRMLLQSDPITTVKALD